MKTKFQRILTIRTRKLLRGDNKNIISFAVCVFIATSLWFLNALNKEYSIELSYPIKYTNLPKDKFLTNTPPAHFILQVNAGGFSILRHKMSMSFTPLVLNYETLISEKHRTDSTLYFSIQTKELENKIANQVSSELKVQSISPYSIDFMFDQLKKKRMPIEPNVSFVLAKQHFISNAISFTPDSIDVYGPSSIIDTMKAVYTEKHHYDKLNQPVRRNVSIAQVKNLQYSHKRVVMEVPVEEYTEQTLSVPIQITNAPEDLKIKLFPDRVSVKFMVSLSNYGNLSAREFKVIADYRQAESNGDVLKTELFYSPDYIYSISMTPSRVEYLIVNSPKHD
ncbi:MAG: hypothetical protein ACK5LR_10865 [Mangrovibacterium sp.]